MSPRLLLNQPCMFAVVAWLWTTTITSPGMQAVLESGREIPLAYDVDVVVVGGGVGAVAAAASAAEQGAKVFLAAPRTYLGEDVAGTLRVWMYDNEEPASPLAERLFGPGSREPHGSASIVGALPLTYKTDLPFANKHKDTKKKTRLVDGTWKTPVSESVQYDGHVNITADLGEVRDVDKAHAMVFHAKDFLVDSVTVSISTDKEEWEEVATLTNHAPKGTDMHPALPFVASVESPARYVRFYIQHKPESIRVLAGEIAVTAPAAEAESLPPEARMHLVRPLHIKRTLDDTLIEAGVEFLFGCFATDLLRDDSGNLGGIAVANRAGRQAVKAKVIIDATDRAWLARMAGAKTTSFPAGLQPYMRVVVGGDLRAGENVEGQKLPVAFGEHNVYVYSLEIPMDDGRFRSFSEAEQRARDMTYHPGQQSAADMLFQVPPDHIVGAQSSTGGWIGVDDLDLGAFRPVGMDRIFILGGCADISRPQAGKLLEPVAMIAMGERIGAAAAKEAESISALHKVSLEGEARLPYAAAERRSTGPSRKGPPQPGQVREFLDGIRSFRESPTIRQPDRALPVLGRYDVVVVGGGTAGAPAGIASARQGAHTLMLEYQYGLGGVGTIGRIAKYYWGNRVGFTATVPGTGWAVEQKMEWWRSELRKAGAEIWFGVLGCGAYVEENEIKGVVVATPEGRGVVLSKVVIDATGNADIAAAAGTPCIYTDASDVALQGTGLPPHQLGRDYTNTDYTIVDETDMMDVWHVFVYGKRMAGNAFDFGKLIDTRERRRIVGDFTISIFDEILGHKHSDTVVQAYSNFDTHGYTVHPYFTLNYPHKKGLSTDIPYRAMLPEGFKGILVVGLGISAHRDAVPVIRMQPDIQNGGYAAGVAAAMSVDVNCPLRKIDIKALQQHLVKMGNLTESTLTDTGNLPLSADRVIAAVKNPTDPYKDVAVILSHPEQSLPLVKEAYAAAENPKDKLHHAQVLSALGDGSGMDTIIESVRGADGLDKGWTYRGMGQFGSCMSPLDSQVYALGRIGDRKAVPAIVEKLLALQPDSDFSHFRAIAVALERIGDPSAADALADVLSREGIRGGAISDIHAALKRAGQHASWTTTTPRANALRELFLARALYRIGDKGGLGEKVLTEYTNDLRGHFARHAHAVLTAEK